MKKEVKKTIQISDDLIKRMEEKIKYHWDKLVILQVDLDIFKKMMTGEEK
tara:strand:+ start:353 stop:502 length:150 start_codon:yes stop_codon:yes gene_type:complete